MAVAGIAITVLGYFQGEGAVSMALTMCAVSLLTALAFWKLAVSR